eukprot:XP_001708284.1 Hypothetical protein GL50803_9926 [Giardia lamblia ATCC 50803]
MLTEETIIIQSKVNFTLCFIPHILPITCADFYELDVF